MKQMSIPESEQIHVDYTAPGYSELVKELRPVLYRDGNSFCCLLGPDTRTGILGSGDSPRQAIVHWEMQLRERLRLVSEEDEVGVYARDVLQASNKMVW